MNKPNDWLPPRIYIACLAAYNNGILHGEWMDAVQDFEDLRSEVDLMLHRSPIRYAEEWAIHDHEGFAPLSIDEHECLADVNAAARLIEEHHEAAVLILDDLGGAAYHEEAKVALQERYAGEWDSVEAWVDELLGEGLYGHIPEALKPYINTEKIGADLHMGGDINALEGRATVHIFWS